MGLQILSTRNDPNKWGSPDEYLLELRPTSADRASLGLYVLQDQQPMGTLDFTCDQQLDLEYCTYQLA